VTTIAVCGLGLLGRPIAERLLHTKHDLRVWNRTPEKVRPLGDAGATVGLTPADAAAGADVAITVLSDAEALNDVVLGPNGLAEGLARGSILAEMSTVGPDAIRNLAMRLPTGIELADAPVLGSVPQAADGTLNVFVGGTIEVYRRLEPMLRDLGRPRHIGPLGTGAAMKLVVNSTLFPVVAAIGEALALGDRMGLPQPTVLDVLSISALAASLRNKRERIESGAYPPNFRLETALKDADLIDRATDGEFPLARAARDLLAGAEEAGMGDRDYSAVVAYIRKALGAKPPTTR
jgi:3-hydroxyisobutyrate dehydrogenase-like beta-hydroxyacid dehydrogenase